MSKNIEISSIDLRYEGYRMRNPRIERELISSILETGIREPLEGVDAGDGKLILLNGFKRYRCAKKLGIGTLPCISLGKDEVTGIIELIRISNTKGLSILEQAILIDELKNNQAMSISDIASSLSMSKSWVSVRVGIIAEMGRNVRDKIFAGKFPVYSYMYTIRQFIRINKVNRTDIDEFVSAVSAKDLSIREIERLAHGYFKGSEGFREQVRKGNIGWCLSRMNRVLEYPQGCNEQERIMLKDLEIVQKYMQRVISMSTDSRLKNNEFYVQANILTEGILNKINIFSKTMRRFYDRTRQT